LVKSQTQDSPPPEVLWPELLPELLPLEPPTVEVVVPLLVPPVEPRLVEAVLELREEEPAVAPVDPCVAVLVAVVELPLDPLVPLLLVPLGPPPSGMTDELEHPPSQVPTATARANLRMLHSATSLTASSRHSSASRR
jgi:hypothetical protein